LKPLVGALSGDLHPAEWYVVEAHYTALRFRGVTTSVHYDFFRCCATSSHPLSLSIYAQFKLVALACIVATVNGLCTPDDNYAGCGCEHTACTVHEDGDVHALKVRLRHFVMIFLFSDKYLFFFCRPSTTLLQHLSLVRSTSANTTKTSKSASASVETSSTLRNTKVLVGQRVRTQTESGTEYLSERASRRILVG
jgi:hypothetical protein